jgi:hypothetical protein
MMIHGRFHYTLSESRDKLFFMSGFYASIGWGFELFRSSRADLSWRRNRPKRQAPFLQPPVADATPPRAGASILLAVSLTLRAMQWGGKEYRLSISARRID